MKRITFCLMVCLTVLTVILSGCAGGQNEGEVQSAESGKETVSSDSQNDEEQLQDDTPVQSTESRSETNDFSVMNDSAPVQPGSSAQEGSEQNTLAKSTSPVSETSVTPSAFTTPEKTEENMLNIEIAVNGETFSAILNDNEAARAFAEMLPLTLDMSDYSGFEKVGSLETSLPTDNRQTTTQSGDIVLYNGNQIVIFYGSNSWSYTRLGKVDDLSGWEEALGGGDVTVTIQVVS